MSIFNISNGRVYGAHMYAAHMYAAHKNLTLKNTYVFAGKAMRMGTLRSLFMSRCKSLFKSLPISLFTTSIISLTTAFAIATPAQAAPYEGQYVIYFGGLTVGAMDIKLDIAGDEYNVGLDIRAKGLSELVTNFSAATQLSGFIEDGRLVSRGYEMQWQYDGEDKFARLNQDTLPLAYETNREAKKRDDIVNPIDINQVGDDTLDPITALLRVSNDGSIISLCEGQQRLFDGTRLAEIKASVIDIPDYLDDEDEREDFVQSCKVEWTPIGGYRQKTADAAEKVEPIYVRYQRVGDTIIHAPEHIEFEAEYGTIVIALKGEFNPMTESHDGVISTSLPFQDTIKVSSD